MQYAVLEVHAQFPSVLWMNEQMNEFILCLCVEILSVLLRCLKATEGNRSLKHLLKYIIISAQIAVAP